MSTAVNGTAVNGNVTLYYESFGDPTLPCLLLINGLGSQCINYATEWCELFAAEGYQVIRFDNRDVGLSSKLDDQSYDLTDMATDALAVLDAAGVARSHVLGCSMGGMIAQRLAIDHGDRLLTMTSVMSRTGEPGYGDSAPDALAFLTGKPAESRDQYIENQLAALRVYGSRPDWLEDDLIRARAAAAYDRCFCPAGVARQMTAVMRDGDRTEALRGVRIPVMVMHGSRDRLIDPSGGRRTAEVIPGARYVEIDGMGHDYPRAVWDRWVGTWGAFARQAVAA
jgi:pimeloyl-ACP methyl ester carboxylesterase